VSDIENFSEIKNHRKESICYKGHFASLNLMQSEKNYRETLFKKFPTKDSKYGE